MLPANHGAFERGLDYALEFDRERGRCIATAPIIVGDDGNAGRHLEDRAHAGHGEGLGAIPPGYSRTGARRTHDHRCLQARKLDVDAVLGGAARFGRSIDARATLADALEVGQRFERHF